MRHQDSNLVPLEHDTNASSQNIVILCSETVYLLTKSENNCNKQKANIVKWTLP